MVDDFTDWSKDSILKRRDYIHSLLKRWEKKPPTSSLIDAIEVAAICIIAGQALKYIHDTNPTD